jgi:spermidine synthase
MSGVPEFPRMRWAAFFLGAAAAIAQVVFARELLVAFLGNELTIGLVLAVWLTGIGAGAAIARRICGGESVRFATTAGLLMAAAGVAMPVQFFAAMAIRGALGIPVGEVGSLGNVLAAAAAVCLPTALVVGLVFPLLCASAPGRGGADASRESGRLYGWESVGSMAGGVALTWLLLPLRSGTAIVTVAAGLAFFGAACLATRRVGIILGVCAATCLFAGILGRPVDRVESASIRARWRGAGLLADGTRLAASRDTVYQNLALLERQGQYTLYANGAISATFPDQLTAEHEIHAIMAQKPSARRVLLLGGNPLDDVRELLRYPLERLVHVELDPGVGQMIRDAAFVEWAALEKDGRLLRVDEDVPRYVKECRETFDVVLVRAADPATLAANRCFTVEFYADVRRRLAADGLMATTVGLSERLQDESATLGAAVYRAVREVFPVVLVTAGARPLFLAGTDQSGLTLDQQTLVGRSRDAKVRTVYFKPEYFLGTDDYDPDKIAHVRERLDKTAAAVNTMSQPVATTYSLALWRRFSGTGSWFAVWITIAAAMAGLFMAARRLLPAGAAIEDRAAGWVICAVLATTGLAAIVTELLLILLFQSAYGYVYTRIGLIFAMFMLGLALGARSGRRWSGSVAEAGRAIVLLEVGMSALAGVALWLTMLSGTTVGDGPAMEIAIYACVMLAGWVTGAEFPVVIGILTVRGGHAGAVVSAADTADHAGAAIGALAATVLLVPWLGVGGTALVLVVLKSLLAIVCGTYLWNGSRESC